MNGFATGVKLSGSLWTTFRDTVVDSNVVGVDFNAATASHYCTTTDFSNCRISANDRAVVKLFLALRHAEGGLSAWPDGRGLGHQPVKLVTAFRTLRHYMHENGEK